MLLFIKSDRVLMVSCLLLLLLVAKRSEALSTIKPQPKTQNDVFSNTFSSLSQGLVVGVTSAALVLTNPTPAFAGDEVRGTPLEPAIVQISNDAYPILTSISDISPLSSKFVSILDKKISSPKATAALDKAIDSFLTIPDDKVSTFVSTLQSAYDGVSGETCQALAGTASTSRDFGALPVVQGLDSTKVTSLSEKFSSANKAVPKSTSSGDICLPASSKGLEQLWIGQTELALNIPKAESKAFVGAASSALTSVPNPDWLKLVPDVKKTLTSNVDLKTATKFEKAGKALEKAFQGDPRIQKRLSTS